MLNEKKLFLLDIDGTICKGTQLLDGVHDFLKDVKNQDGKCLFITNNATRSVSDYKVYFQNMGLDVEEKDFVTTTIVTAEYLKKHHDKEMIFVVGTDSFIQELEKKGIQTTQDPMDSSIACVVISYDNQLTYQKLENACRVLTTRDVDYIATNPDLVCPNEFGFVPDCGSICEIIEHAVQKKPRYMGKPDTAIVQFAMKTAGMLKAQALLVGDRLYTDIACGNRAGIDTALVLTGEAIREDVQHSSYHPTYVFDSIAALHKEWTEENSTCI